MLKQSYRLKKRQDFRRVYQRGSSLKNRAFVLCFRAYRPRSAQRGAAEAKGSVRIGFSVSKKIGKAVERNRVRRLLREACRLELARFPAGFDYVLIARLGAKAESLDSLRQKLRILLANKALQPKGAPRPESGEI